MVTLDRLKLYLRIDEDYENELLQQFLVTAQAYLNDAISNYHENYSMYPEFATKADLLMLVLASELYQNRDNSPHDFSYTIKTLMLQLQYFASVDTEFDSETTSSDSTLTFAMFDKTGNLIDSGIGIANEEAISKMLDDVGLEE